MQSLRAAAAPFYNFLQTNNESTCNQFTVTETNPKLTVTETNPKPPKKISFFQELVTSLPVIGVAWRIQFLDFLIKRTDRDVEEVTQLKNKLQLPSRNDKKTEQLAEELDNAGETIKNMVDGPEKDRLEVEHKARCKAFRKELKQKEKNVENFLKLSSRKYVTAMNLNVFSKRLESSQLGMLSLFATAMAALFQFSRHSNRAFVVLVVVGAIDVSLNMFMARSRQKEVDRLTEMLGTRI